MKSLLLASFSGIALSAGVFAQTPVNDDCSGSLISGEGVFAFEMDTVNATDSTIDGAACVDNNRPSNLMDVWFEWTCMADGVYTFETIDSNMVDGYDTVMVLYDGIACDATTCIAGNDDIGGGNFASLVNSGQVLTAGSTYTIQVGAWEAATVPTDTNTLTITNLGLFEPNNDCDGAIALTGFGTLDVDNTNTSSSGFTTTGCSTTIDLDLFYTWTAPYDGDFSFDTFGTDFDTVISVHTGCEPATAVCLGSNDDFVCNDIFTTQSRVIVSGMLAGDVVLIQWGAFSIGNGPGFLNIADAACDECILDDASEDNDDCGTAASIPMGTTTAYFINQFDEDHYTVNVPDGATLNVDCLFVDVDGDLDVAFWDATDMFCSDSGPGGNANGTRLAIGQSVDDDESVSWANTTGSAVDVVIEVFAWPSGAQAEQCNTYDMVVDVDNGGFPTFCEPTNPNSTGAPTVLSGSFGSGVGSDLHLDAAGGPPGQFGYVLVTSAVSEPGIPISDGHLCFDFAPGSLFGRYNFDGTDQNSIGQFDSAGDLQNLVGTSTSGSGYDVPASLPLPGNPLIMSGETWHFQCWHRDIPAGANHSNLSNGVSVTFP